MIASRCVLITQAVLLSGGVAVVEWRGMHVQALVLGAG